MVTFSFYSGLSLDGALYKPVMNFLQKLAEDPTNPSLRIKTLNNAVDKRVRTGRVNDQFRAVLFEIKDSETHHFVLVDVDSHDEGNAKAERLDPARLRLAVNPVNGLTQLIQEEAPSTADSGSSDSETESERKAKAAAEAAKKLAEQQQLQASELSKEKGVDAVVVDKQKPAPRAEMERNGYTPASLYEELGVEEALTEAVWRIESEKELEMLLDGRPTWEHDAILGLVAGYTVEQVRESLGLQKLDPQEDAADEDARLLAGLRHPAAELDFAYVDDVDTDSLRAVIDAGSFDQWRVYIHPEQRRMAEGARSGSSRVFGGAGTGKTVVAVHRANNLARRSIPNQDPGELPPRVLLTTFTKGLAQGLKSQLNALNPHFPEAPNPGEGGIWVDNVDAVVRQVLNLASTSEVEMPKRDNRSG